MTRSAPHPVYMLVIAAFKVRRLVAAAAAPRARGGGAAAARRRPRLSIRRCDAHNVAAPRRHQPRALGPPQTPQEGGGAGGGRAHDARAAAVECEKLEGLVELGREPR